MLFAGFFGCKFNKTVGGVLRVATGTGIGQPGKVKTDQFGLLLCGNVLEHTG